MCAAAKQTLGYQCFLELTAHTHSGCSFELHPKLTEFFVCEDIADDVLTTLFGDRKQPFRRHGFRAAAFGVMLGERNDLGTCHISETFLAEPIGQPLFLSDSGNPDERSASVVRGSARFGRPSHMMVLH